MDPVGPETEVSSGRGERRHRKRRAFWRRRQFWIVLLAAGVAILLVLWLISSIGYNNKEVD